MARIFPIPNPYEAPQTPPRRRSKFPLVLGNGFACVTWALFGGLMWAQYNDVALSYVPDSVMNWWRVAGLLGLFGVSSLFLVRAIVGQFQDEGE